MNTTATALRPAAALILVHLLLSLAAVAVLVVDRDQASVATTDAWVHGVIVAATAVLLLTFVLRALRASTKAYLRLRISSSVLLVALVVIVLLPGAFPDWMRALEAGSAVCLLGVVAVANRPRTRREMTRLTTRVP
jgi:hypothetical protein